ncbi:MAG: sugar phosphate isomerase/epimerase [Thaumarchaeota archaeon]|nr:sugar phosphate isomerase/epimerase [Nitrososphaerota archaeon]
MKLGFSTNAFVKKTLTEAIQTIHKFRFEGIEIVTDSPHAFLPLNKLKIQTIKKNLRNSDLKVSNINANTAIGWYKNGQIKDQFEPSLSNLEKKLRQWRTSYSKRAIDFAYDLDAPSICVTSGTKNLTNDTELFQNSLEEISQYAEKKNIRIAIEYEPGLLIGTANDVFSIMKNYKNVGLNLDTCHAAVLNEDMPKIINKFGKKIFHTHISDCKNNIHFHLIPGLGEINFEEVLDSLKKINYDGFLTAELYTYSEEPERAAKDTFIYLSNLIN